MLLLATQILPVKILNTAITWCASIAMIFVVIFLVKDIKDVVKGDKSIGAVLVKLLMIFILLGLMYLAGSFDTFAKIFQNIFQHVVTSDNMPDVGQK